LRLLRTLSGIKPINYFKPTINVINNGGFESLSGALTCELVDWHTYEREVVQENIGALHTEQEKKNLGIQNGVESVC
jgi:hypothetical protein